jgi:hypothetical protein
MPSTRLLAPVCLALLVLLAGCTMPAEQQSEPPSPSGSEPTDTVSATPTDSTRPALPPGVTESGVTNASALLSAHGDALREAGYRLDVIRGGTGTTYVSEANYSAYRVVPGPTASNPAVWANESVAVARETRENETVYHRPPRPWPSPARMTGSEALRTLFDASQYTVNGTAACGDRECTVLRADGSSRFGNFSARALVHESGVVHQFHATYTVDGESTAFHLVLEQRGNVTVERPPWVDTALAET